MVSNFPFEFNFVTLRFGSNVSMRSSARGGGGGGGGGGSVARGAASMGGISLKPATENSVHDVIFRAYKTPQNVNANREDAVRVVRWLAHMDARGFKPPSSSSSSSPSVVGSSAPAAKENQRPRMAAAGGKTRHNDDGDNAAAAAKRNPPRPGEVRARAAHLVNAVAFAELVRQTTVHCAERGGDAVRSFHSPHG